VGHALCPARIFFKRQTAVIAVKWQLGFIPCKFRWLCALFLQTFFRGWDLFVVIFVAVAFHAVAPCVMTHWVFGFL
jgi:hypothetical protein